MRNTCTEKNSTSLELLDSYANLSWKLGGKKIFSFCLMTQIDTVYETEKSFVSHIKNISVMQ